MAPPGKKGLPTKQFFEINGTPILVHTLRVFARNKQVTHIVVALRKNEMEQFSRRLEQEKIHAKVALVEGGEHRQDSVANALASLQAAPDDIVLVHDAVRPFVDDEIIAGVIREVEKHGAAIAGLPGRSAETITISLNWRMANSESRSAMFPARASAPLY